MPLPNFNRRTSQTQKNLTRSKQANAPASRKAISNRGTNVPWPTTEVKTTSKDYIKKRAESARTWKTNIEKAAQKFKKPNTPKVKDTTKSTTKSTSKSTKDTKLIWDRWLTESQSKYLLSTYDKDSSEQAKNRALKMLQINKNRWLITPEQYNKLSKKYAPTTTTTTPATTTPTTGTTPSIQEWGAKMAQDIPTSPDVSSDVDIPEWGLLDQRRAWEFDNLRDVLEWTISKRDEFLQWRQDIRDTQEQILREQLSPEAVAEVWEPFDIAKEKLALEKDKELYEIEKIRREEMKKFEDLQMQQKEQNALMEQSIVRLANTVWYKYSPQMSNQIQATKNAWIEALNDLQETAANFNIDTQMQMWFISREYMVNVATLDSKQNQAIRDYQNDLTDKLLWLQMQWLNDSEQAWEKNRAEVDNFMSKLESVNSQYLSDIADQNLQMQKNAAKIQQTRQRAIDKGTVNSNATDTELYDSITEQLDWLPKSEKEKISREKVKEIYDWVKEWRYLNVKDWVNQVFYWEDSSDMTWIPETEIQREVMKYIWDMSVSERWKLDSSDIQSIVEWISSWSYWDIETAINTTLLEKTAEEDRISKRELTQSQAKELAKKAEWDLIATVESFSWIYWTEPLSTEEINFLWKIPDSVSEIKLLMASLLYSGKDFEEILEQKDELMWNVRKAVESGKADIQNWELNITEDFVRELAQAYESPEVIVSVFNRLQELYRWYYSLDL